MRKDPVLERRSIRRYTGKDVDEKDVKKVLEAAMAAPSAGNERPWHFVVLRERRLLDGVMEVHPYAQMLEQSPVAVLVCGDPSLEKYKGFWVQDCAAATENMLIMATQLGLGAVWLGIHPIEERVHGLRLLLGIPQDIVPFALVPLGHPDELKRPVDRYDDSRVHRDGW
ncbi:MAG: nitroreductase A [Methanomassiliicoccales archaeon PtaB.Bin134]|nr:MAG: nitroreductase A [Methanomassiliicoccales archaeon PtaB.Bin134]